MFTTHCFGSDRSFIAKARRSRAPGDSSDRSPLRPSSVARSRHAHDGFGTQHLIPRRVAHVERRVVRLDQTSSSRAGRYIPCPAEAYRSGPSMIKGGAGNHRATECLRAIDTECPSISTLLYIALTVLTARGPGSSPVGVPGIDSCVPIKKSRIRIGKIDARIYDLWLAETSEKSAPPI